MRIAFDARAAERNGSGIAQFARSALSALASSAYTDAKVKAALGEITSYACNLSGDRTGIVDAVGSVSYFSFDSDRRLVVSERLL